MDTPIEVLRIDQNTVSKELVRFRACDTETRCFYCREWAQYIYKKHFVWNAKTQEDITIQANSLIPLQAGSFQVHFRALQDDQAVTKKQKANILTQQFEGSEMNSNDILDACQRWMTLPSSYSGLPDLFEKVEFNPFPDNIPLVEDTKDPAHLLDPLIIERQALCLPSDGFYLLKNLTSDILLSHSQPTCEHTKPESKTPADLEMDRAIFNEKAEMAVKRALIEVGKVLDQSWSPLNGFIDNLKQHINERNMLMGSGCQATVDQFFISQQYQPFVDYWSTQQSSFNKKKKGEQDLEKLDRLVLDHFNGLKQKVDNFITSFALPHLDLIRDLTLDLWKLIAGTINEMNQRINSLECLKDEDGDDDDDDDDEGKKEEEEGKIASSIKLKSTLEKFTSNPLNVLDSTKEVDVAKQNIIPELQKRVDEYKKEIDDLVVSYQEAKLLSGRIDKLNHKDFKKRVRKLESGYYSIRQYFRYEVTTNIFPESLFCKFILVCLESLMQEGELLEGVALQKEMRRCVETYKDLLLQRHTLLTRFEEGVQTGRRELAGILGKLFLKEGMRIQGDTLALKRQNNLLKSMGVAVEEEPISKKKKSSKKKNATTTTTTTVESGSSTPTRSGASTPSVSASLTKKVVKEEKKQEQPKQQTKKKDVSLEEKKVKKDNISSVVKEIKEKPKEINSIEEWKNMKNLKQSEAVTDGWNTIPIKQTSVKQSSVIKKNIIKESSPEVTLPNVTPAAPEVQDWKSLTSEMKKNEDSNGWASVAKSNIAQQSNTFEELPKKQKKKDTESPKEEWPTVSSKASTSNVSNPSGGGWSSIVTKTVSSKTPEIIPDSPSKPTTTSDDVKEWSAVNTESTTIDWSSIVTKTVSTTSNTPDIIPDSPSKTATTTTGGVEEWPSATTESATTGWSSKLTESTNSGWSSKPVESTNINGGWDFTTTTTTTEVQEVATNDGWSSKAIDDSTTTTNVANGWSAQTSNESTNNVIQTQITTTESADSGWSTQTTKDSWSTPAATTSEPVKKDGWSAAAAAAAAAVEPKDSGWSTQPVTSEPTTSYKNERSTTTTQNNGWTNKKIETLNETWSTKKTTPAAETNSSWGTKTNRNSWSTKNDRSSSENLGGWGSISSSTHGWDKKQQSNDNSNNSSNWGQRKDNNTWETKRTSSSIDVPSSWDPTIPSSTDTSSEWQERSNSDNWRKKPTNNVNQYNNQNYNSRNNEIKQTTDSQIPWNNTTPTTPISNSPPPPPPKETSRPPGFMNETVAISNVPPPPPPPGLSMAETTTTPVSVPDLLQMNNPLLSAAQLQAPLPNNLDELGSDNLMLLTRNLHNQNSQLIQTVYSMQQEINMMTRRYSDIINLTREKEQQTLQLLEAKRQTEIEEARRYVLGLEARIQQLESAKMSASFSSNNQDLFAGYRDEMGDYQQQQQQQHRGGRKTWSKHSLRCGNCGELGHQSNSCTSLCRYCGNSDHLSDACPNNS